MAAFACGASPVPAQVGDAGMLEGAFGPRTRAGIRRAQHVVFTLRSLPIVPSHFAVSVVSVVYAVTS